MAFSREELKSELVDQMEGVHLNNGRIEQLVEQLYILNRTLVGYEGRLLPRAADLLGIDFAPAALAVLLKRHAYRGVGIAAPFVRAV